MATALGAPLIRLQCYEGLAVNEALYEWNYQRQLLAIRLAEAQGRSLVDADLFTEEFLLERPILACLRHQGPVAPVLLIDEIDRADAEFEALLFEFLGEGSVTIPELGTLTAVHPPVVVLTSNRSRELHDALKRRCLYHWIDFPGVARASEIVRRSVPGGSDALGVGGHRLRGAGARARPRQGAGPGRGDQLGVGPLGPGRHRPRAARRGPHARGGGQDTRRS